MSVILNINRKWFFVLKNGVVAMDWGDGLAQEVISGKYLKYEDGDWDHAILDAELRELVETRRVVRFDDEKVAVLAWENDG